MLNMIIPKKEKKKQKWHEEAMTDCAECVQQEKVMSKFRPAKAGKARQCKTPASLCCNLATE